MKLVDFIIKAKMATYASEEESNEKILEDGSKELTFRSGDFKYRDRYYGFNPFFGEEIVWQGGEIVWSMNYFGKMSSDKVSDEDVYKFLQSAMRQIKEDRPFRGPSNFKSGGFEYIDESIGDVHNFTGTERILHEGQEIYRLNYHGGSM
ncbi:MAG: DUF5680 domain-containing protein [Candidatus Moranbacteria bacterium]|nr:DUF5680 domain-containing protein [Candidatus Moranbacteria bacterium]